MKAKEYVLGEQLNGDLTKALVFHLFVMNNFVSNIVKGKNILMFFKTNKIDFDY